ncbi:hypothetical protein [Pseudonocardia xinjiangensis]|uniref:Uncharacterized protein n=1 Tax=Pseudonocardia xinjiangensis TaxID=75289 RepID=A0ABX1R8G6_9PSEU|nr:hypothetical protein [Pseudonocardia xinjiangensis]NMH75959.1 hypothetical protein [Pseudonocardia xinjiangensis]
MQLPLTTNGLVPVGVGVVVALALVLLIVFAMRRRRPVGAAPHLRDRGMRDWTGLEPHHVLAPPPPPAMPAVQWSTGLAAPSAHQDAPVRGWGDAAPKGYPDSASTTGSAATTGSGASGGSPGEAYPVAGPGTPAAPPSTPAGNNHTVRPLLSSLDAASRSGLGSRSNAADSTGSGRTVAAAVAQAFAVRAAAVRSGRLEQIPGTSERNGSAALSTPPTAVPPSSDPPAASAAVPAQPSTAQADVRDRLLAVLLDDPARAVGATAELEACRSRLQDVLHRLAASGLRPEQLARLVELPVEEVRTILASAAGSPAH